MEGKTVNFCCFVFSL